jgi:hypothetical protein
MEPIVSYGEYGQRMVGAELTVPTVDDEGVQCFAVVVFDSWSNIGGTADVVAAFRMDADGVRTETTVDERRAIRVVLDVVYDRGRRCPACGRTA